MWFLNCIINFFLLTSVVNSNSIITTDFELAGQGYGDITNKSSKRFITAYDKNYYVFKIDERDSNLTKKVDECLSKCYEYDNCNGVFFGLNKNNYFKRCIGLSYLGRLGGTNTYSLSYVKIRTHNFLNHSHFISGRIHNNLELGNVENVYLDVNLNHKYDHNEPLLIPDVDGYYEFSNLQSNYYSVNQYLPHSCIQIKPSFNSQNFDFKYNGYPNNIVKYYDSGLGIMSGELGGYLHGANINELENLDGKAIKDIVINIEPYMIVNNNSEYTVFIPEQSYIDFAFSYHYLKNVSISVNYLYNVNSDDYASIFVSQDNVNYEYLGDIKSQNDTLLLNNTDFLVQFIRIKGQSSNGLTRGFPFVSLYVNSTVEYKSEFSQLVQFGSDKDYSTNIDFFNNCGFQLECNNFCKHIYGNKTNYELVSCYNGCELFTNTQSCNCNNYTPCYHGCYYNFEQFISPNYSLHHNNYTKYYKYYNDILECYTSSCLLDALTNCNNNINCKLILYNGLQTYYFYDYHFNHTFNKNLPEQFEFLVKNMYLFEKNVIDDVSTTLISTTTTSTTTSTTTTSTTSTTTTSTTTTSTTSTSTTSTSTTSTSTTSTSTTTTSTTSTTNQVCDRDNCNIEILTSTTNQPKNTIQGTQSWIIILSSSLSALAFIIFIVLVILFLVRRRQRQRRENIENQDNNLRVTFNNPIYQPSINLNHTYEDVTQLMEPDHMEESNI